MFFLVRRRMSTWSSLSSSVLLLAACQTGTPSGSEWAGRVDTVGGTVAVHNPADPAWPAGAASVHAIWRTDREDSLATGHAPIALTVIGDRVMVLDSESRSVLALSRTTGMPEARIGRGGGGPGELERPILLTAVGHTLLVYDAGRRSVERFDENGAYRGSVVLGTAAFAALPWTSGALFPALQSEPLFVDSLGQVTPIHLAAVPGEPPLDAHPDCQRVGVLGVRVVFSCRDRPAWFGYEVGAGLVWRVTSGHVPVQRPDSAVNAYVDRLVRQMQGSPDSLIGLLAQRARLSNRIKLSFGKLQRDPEAGWITMLDQDQIGGWGAHPGRLLLFTGDGRFVAELDLPSAWVDHVVYGGHVYAIEEDEDGYRTVARFAINLPNDLSVYLGAEH